MTDETDAAEGTGTNAGAGPWSRAARILRAYRIYWLTPIVLGLVLLAVTVIFADSETLGRFSYFNF